MSKQGRAATGRHSIDYRRSGDSGELTAQGSCRGVGEPPKGRAPGAAIPWGDPRSIWPGPERSTKQPEWRPLKPVTVWLERDGRVNHTGPLDQAFKRSPVIGIALGHVRARARMGRFLAWCRKQGACLDGHAFARLRRSPEHAMQDAAAAFDYETRLSVSWVAWHGLGEGSKWSRRIDDARWSYRPAALIVATRDFLASPEWASLPWQQEPGGER